MKLFILTMLLSIAQTSPPTPRQTPDSATSASQTSNNQASRKQQPTDSSSITSKEQPPTTNGNRGDQTDKNTNNPIRIGELPPVTISSRRDWADWGTWFFTLLLAVTSALQVWLLCRTLIFARRQTHEIKRQRSYMRLQWVQMIEAGKQTKEIIAQMKETEVRDLRAYVGISEVRLNLQEWDFPKGMIETKNFGKTPAYNVRQWMGITINSHPLPVALPEHSDSGIASVSVIFPGVKNTNIAGLKKRLPPNTAIGTPEITVYVYGKITYEDIFKNEWHSDSRFIFGGPEKGRTYTDERNTRWGAMYPDSEGNNAT